MRYEPSTRTTHPPYGSRPDHEYLSPADAAVGGAHWSAASVSKPRVVCAAGVAVTVAVKHRPIGSLTNSRPAKRQADDAN
jgi:hypothetical protein